MNVAGSEVLSLALTQNKTLEELVLSGPRNYIGTAGSCVIASALLENKTLKKLWMDRNNISWQGLTSFLEMFEQSKVMEEMDLSYNLLGDPAGRLIEKHFGLMGSSGQLGALKRINIYGHKFSQKYLPKWQAFQKEKPFDSMFVLENPTQLHAALSGVKVSASVALAPVASSPTSAKQKRPRQVPNANNVLRVIELALSGQYDKIETLDRPAPLIFEGCHRANAQRVTSPANSGK